MPTVAMFHGTSDVHLDSLMAHGLRVPRREGEKLSFHVTSKGSEDHLMSLDGIYVAADQEATKVYAKQACQHQGGSQIMLTLMVETMDAVPDEDHLLEFLTVYGEDLPMFFDMDGFLDRWKQDHGFRNEVSAKMAKDLVLQFAPERTEGVGRAMAEILQFGLDAMDEEDLKDMIERNCHVLDPVLFQAARNAEGGMEQYRLLMDRLARSMSGTQPYADVESHSLRILADVGFAGNTRIVGIGTAEDPFSVYAGEINETEAALLRDACIEPPTPAPALA